MDMKQFSKLYSFGCSFTEGGGLNSPIYHHYLNGRVGDIDFTWKDEYQVYMHNNSYPYYLSKLLNCNFENHGISKASNELIFDNVYKLLNSKNDLNNTLITIQTTVLSRMLLYSTDNNEFISVNGIVNDYDFVAEYYKLYIQHFFDNNTEFNKLLKNIDLYTTYITSKGADVIWIIYDGIGEKIIEDKYKLSFHGYNLGEYIENNKLQIRHIPGMKFNDLHCSVEGNKVIANKIYQHLGKYYD